jgi:hypothetical protein
MIEHFFHLAPVRISPEIFKKTETAQWYTQGLGGNCLK